ncbi:UDP-N-acetylglucosamine 1-carboxyvinyltransferase [Candidatus Uhrbacteria bacterium RIFCSPHIGHO2_02_FULL_57_19]|uniref:UDP-N-acetylglucosamine 1-carboxyvinyltransferase n=1 Tax=Candidatus Uhrbacteria bacterium RIFCSPHIGHO2_02_FULL_57_19 TaxID=1802391 RepID=A0A1F7U2X5_9BACT|nr:MAG: UDP-N-acetylglucosamine 1-carboxyvinyltransferase [Candidatus Uhrbacteria bacterium RIFCSPHIGHO2_02_FULL_57_19]
MARFEIHGGKPLSGEIRVSGAKNAALKFLAAALLTEEEVRLRNVPEIEDIKRMVEIIRELGVQVDHPEPHQYNIRAASLKTSVLSRELAPKIRPSMLLIGPLLVRTGSATLPHPGGCAIGRRPTDLFVHGFRKLGATVEEGVDERIFRAGTLRGGRFVFPTPSVTATEALMIMAVRTSGRTELVNVAMEPEIPALAEFLNSCGAKITGGGTPIIIIEGVDRIRGGEISIMPDRIEAGSFAALAAATKSDLWIRGCNPKHLEVPLLMLEKIGVKFEVASDSIHVMPSDDLEAMNITTHEYPGFPTDLQAPFTVLLTQAKGVALVHETIFEGRLFYIEHLNKMGAKIVLSDQHRAVVEGPTPLRGSTLESPDIRAGLALVIAALAAKGKSTINNVYQIDRGYERIEERLRAISADIRRIE